MEEIKIPVSVEEYKSLIKAQMKFEIMAEYLREVAKDEESYTSGRMIAKEALARCREPLKEGAKE